MVTTWTDLWLKAILSLLGDQLPTGMVLVAWEDWDPWHTCSLFNI